ncbi:hypothetical protein TSUD_124900 [Trifolium subterraneum]|uniref:NB-ARC domain-containing protein n=1 Tax=Trifolium subterraneum TaxID=3900 RepID=A0A2Z6MKB2_TRISU|nr:hypothetical protein TSUD_124900 [Trifolium subterraneum]
MFCFTSLVKEYEEETIKLEAEITIIKSQYGRLAQQRGNDIMLDVQSWEEQVNKLIHEDMETKKRCFFGFCSDCIWRYKMGENLANKIKEIKKLRKKGKKLKNIELTGSLPNVERYSTKSYISFRSRELKYKELLNALKDDRYYIIGLHGMGGTGKTTLAQQVGRQLHTSMQFKCVIITTVSNMKRIQDDIAGPLGLKWGDINESDRPKKLWSRLTNGDKILVILDDVWGNLNFDDIGIPNSDNNKGCKVLVTTRYLWVCNIISCGITIQLELLSEEEAWAMFKRRAELSDISSKGLLKQGRKIALECKRLPVAIATIASSLKGQKRREEWDVVLKSLQNPMSMGDVDDTLVDIYKCLKLSYDNLNDEKAKGLFLLCFVFREDEEISTEILTRLGIGVGLFGEGYDKYNDARNLLVVAKNKLIDSCLLLKVKEGDAKMNEWDREVAQFIANKEIQTVNFSNKSQKSFVESCENIKYLSCEGNLMDLFSSKFSGLKLEILNVNVNRWDTVKIPISFFQRISRLRVLSLLNKSSNLERPTLSLPPSIQSLTDIHSLLVERVYLGDISILGSLHSLETLDLDHCQIDELPCEIAKLKKLRLLNLEKCEITSNNPFEVIAKCTSLEELYFCNSFNKSCKKIMFPPLERYRIIDGFGKMNYPASKCVSFQNVYFSETIFKYVMQTVELLQLERIEKGWINLMPEVVPIDPGMNDLVELRLKYFSKLQCLVDSELNESQVPTVFSKLVILHLEDMKDLKSKSVQSSNHHTKVMLNIGFCFRIVNFSKPAAVGELEN